MRRIYNIYKRFFYSIFAWFFNMISKMKKVNGKILQLIGLISCTCWMTSCKQEQAGGQTGANYAIMKVETADKELSTSYSATIRGRQDINILPQVSGTIERVCIEEGEKVKKGQLLFVIDQVPYKAALQTAEANVEAAKAGLATAELSYNSNKELYAKKVVSEYSLKTSENAYLTAKAQLAQAKAQEVNARNNLSYTEVKSPSDGVAGMLPYRVGALVSPSIQTPLTVVSDNSDMYVYFSMTENQLLSLTRKYGTMDEAITNMPAVKLQLNDGSIYSEPGKIESISGVIDRQTGAVGVRAVFPNASRLLHSGASGNVIIPEIYKNCIVIPQTATVQIQDKIQVWKVVDGKAVSGIIKVAPTNDGREYVVLEGLKQGEEIVKEGAGLIRPGQQVKQ